MLVTVSLVSVDFMLINPSPSPEVVNEPPSTPACSAATGRLVICSAVHDRACPSDNETFFGAVTSCDGRLFTFSKSPQSGNASVIPAPLPATGVGNDSSISFQAPNTSSEDFILTTPFPSHGDGGAT